MSYLRGHSGCVYERVFKLGEQSFHWLMMTLELSCGMRVTVGDLSWDCLDVQRPLV